MPHGTPQLPNWTYLPFQDMARWTSDPWTALVAALASYRVTRLITIDHLPPMEDLRNWLADRTPEGYDTLWECPHCMSFWVACAVAGLAELADRKRKRKLFLLLAMPWAISTVAGAIVEREAS